MSERQEKNNFDAIVSGASAQDIWTKDSSKGEDRKRRSSHRNRRSKSSHRSKERDSSRSKIPHRNSNKDSSRSKSPHRNSNRSENSSKNKRDRSPNRQSLMGSVSEIRHDDEDSSGQDSDKSLGTSNKTGLGESIKSNFGNLRLAKRASEDHEAKESGRGNHPVKSPVRSRRSMGYQRSPRHHEKASTEKKEKRESKATRAGAENVSSTADRLSLNKVQRSRNSHFRRLRRQEAPANRQRQLASVREAISVEEDANAKTVRQQVQEAITHIIKSPDTTIRMGGDSDDSDTENLQEKPPLMCRGRLLCLLALLLIVIGGGVAAYIVLVDPFNGGSARMTPPVSDQIPEMLSGSPTVSASEAPSETLLFGPPSKRDCAAIRNGQNVDGQDELEALDYDISIEIIVDEEGNYAGTMATLVLRVREELLPSLAGCTDSSRRSLGHTREDSQPLLEKSRRLEDTQHPIANAFVSGDYDDEATCGDDVVEDCRVGKLTLEIFVKGEGQESAVEDIIDDVFGISDPSQSLGNKLELVEDGVLDIQILTLENVNPTNGPNSAPSPIAVPSVEASAFPTLSPSITLSDNPSLAPVIGPTTASPSITLSDNPSLAPVIGSTTAKPTRSPSKPPSATPTPAPTPPPTQPPIPGPTPSPTLPPTVIPVVALTPVPSPTSPPIAAPTTPPTLRPTPPPTPPPTPVSTPNPTPGPTQAPTPTPGPTPNPTPAPTVSGGPDTYCCSNDYKDCNVFGPWCNASKNNCGQCSGYYIMQGSCPPSGIKKWGDCSGNVNDCCAPTTCVATTWGGAFYSQCL